MQSHPSSRRVTRGAHTLALSLILSLALVPLIETANASQTPTPTPATVQNKLALTSVPWVPNAGQWDARAAFRAQSFAGAVWVTADGKLVHQFNGARANVGADLVALSGRPDARPSPRLPKSVRGEPVERRSPGWVLTERFVGGAIKQAPRGSDPHIGRVSFMTSDTVAQADNLPSYGQVELGEVFPGVSVALKATNANVEKLFTVAPGRDPSVIRVAVDGAERLSIGNDGSLVATTGNGDIAFTAPIAFQEIDGVRKDVPVAYRLVGPDATTAHYAFTLGDYDRTRPLTIDPLLASTYLGGNGSDGANAIAIHPHSGEVYVVGSTDSSNFPQTAGGAEPSQPLNSGTSCFVSRYRADLSRLIQSTYVGYGNLGCSSIAFARAGDSVYVAGTASGTATFPVGSLSGTIQGTHAHLGNPSPFVSDGFVARLSADLRTLVKATYFGGSGGVEWIAAIAVHPHTGFVHIAGTTDSTVLPGTAVGTQTTRGGGQDVFIARLPADLMGPAASTVRYTFVGGGNADGGHALAIDARSGDVFVAGDTGGGLPVAMLSGAAQSAFAGPTPTSEFASGEAFVARLKQDLSAVVRATYLGGSDPDLAFSLAISPRSGEVLVAGRTLSTDFPGKAGGAQPVYGGGFYDAFVSRLSPGLTAILQSTYVGGGGSDCQAFCLIAIHSATDEVFIAGDTGGLPAALVAGGVQTTVFNDVFVVRINASLTAFRAGTHLGSASNADYLNALAIEPNGGSVYVGGAAFDGGFPMVNAQQPLSAGGLEAFVSRLSTDLTAVNRTPNPFSFIHQSHVPPNTLRTSNEVQIVITPTPPDNQQVAYVIGGTNSEFCVTNAAGCCATPLPACSGFATGWINGPYEFLSGDRIAVRHTSANPSGTTETRLIISGQAYPFRSSTGNATIACNLDMNGDNVLTSNVEGLILVRAMLGFGGNAAVQGTNITAFEWENTLRPALNANCGTNFPFTPIL